MTDTAPRIDSPTHSPRRSPMARLGWILAWALSVVLAFVLGLQSRSTPEAAPRAGASAATADPTATNGSENTAPAASAPPSQKAEVTEFLKTLPKRDPSDPAAKGRPDAKVVLIEWSDYRCPFCAVWAKRTLPALQRFVDDGTLRIEYRDLPLFGEQSLNAAVAAKAAGQQGRFWEYYDAVFANAPTSGHPEIGPAEIQRFAEAAGVPDMAKFSADLADPELKAQVTAEGTQAQQMGISGTPFFVVNTQIINGAQPTEAFVQAVETAKRG